MVGGSEHVSERFRRLLALYRKPNGSEWGGQDLENATGGAVTRSYVANLKNGRIENPGLAKLGAISERSLCRTIGARKADSGTCLVPKRE